MCNFKYDIIFFLAFDIDIDYVMRQINLQTSGKIH